MRLRKLVAGLVAGTALAATVALAPAASANGTSSSPTLAGILDAQGPIDDRNWYDFDILNAAVDTIIGSVPGTPLALAASPNPVVNGTPVKLTAFIPNDRAFQALAADVIGWRMWFATESQVANALVAKYGAATLNDVVLYHVVAGPTAIDSATALSVPKGTPLTTVQGGQIRVTPVPFFGSAILADNDPDDINPFLIPGRLDIHASNGIAHGIAFVLRPGNL